MNLSKELLVEVIKELLDLGMSFQVPHKGEISSWYGELKVYQYGNFYYVGHTKFSDLDEAINFFLTEAFTSKNVGYVQSRLMKRNLLDEYDLENPTSEVEKLFKDEGEIVDEEAKVWNLKPISFPKAKDAIDEFEKLVETLTPENLKSSLSEFDKKYATLDPYIGISFRYYVEGNEYGYRQSFDYKDFSIDYMDKAKSREDLPQYKMKWNCVHISFSIKGGNNNDFQFFDLKF